MNHSPACPVCNTSCQQPIKPFKNSDTEVFICPSCSLEFVYPFLLSSDDAPSSTTAPEYIKYMQSRYEQVKELINFRAKQRLEIYTSLLGRRPERILEIGCGSGWMTKGLADLGVEMLGIEYDVDLAKSAQSLLAKSDNASVWQGDIVQMESLPNSYDVVFSSQVFEHIFTPSKALKNACRFINSQGIVHIDVPNGSSWGAKVRRMRPGIKMWSALDLPEHQISYQPSSLKKLLVDAELEVISIEEKPTDDQTFGQTILPSSLPSKVFIGLSHYLGHGYLLVGLARKK
jgi:2-polyprenyl-3-methyl-5-hydroxy-6-metoxy-1,4-benzoquinol methylase